MKKRKELPTHKGEVYSYINKSYPPIKVKYTQLNEKELSTHKGEIYSVKRKELSTHKGEIHSDQYTSVIHP